MSEQPKDPQPPDAIDDATAPKARWNVWPPEPYKRVPDPAPAEVIEGVRTLYG